MDGVMFTPLTSIDFLLSTSPNELIYERMVLGIVVESIHHTGLNSVYRGFRRTGLTLF